jgi:hypothetical protein
MNAVDRAEALSKSLKVEGFKNFNTWTLDLLEALNSKMEALELEISKLRIKNGTSK